MLVVGKFCLFQGDDCPGTFLVSSFYLQMFINLSVYV